METGRTARIVDRIIPALLLFVLVVPLIFGKMLLFPFVVYRTYAFFVVVDIALLLLLVRSGFSSLVPKDRLLRWWWAVLGIFLVTDILGLGFGRSFFGNYERLMGWITWGHLALYATIIARVFRSTAAFRKVFIASTVVATLVLGYGVLQKYHVAFAIRDLDDRLFSTVGNPAFLASYLLWQVFIAGYLWITEKSRWRWAYLALGVSFVGGIFLTATRGAVLGLFAGIVALVVYLIIFPSRIFSSSKVVRRGAMGVLIVVGVLPILLWSLRTNPILQSTLIGRRLSTLSLAEESTISRLRLWQLSGRATQERWLTGYGGQHVDAAIDRHFDPRIKAQWFDSTHSVWLDTLVAHGIIGLLACIIFFGYLVLRLHRLGANDPGVSLFLAGLVAYAVQGMFIFDTLVGWLPLAVIIGYVARDELPDTEVRKKIDRIGQIAGSILILIAFFSYGRAVSALGLVTASYRTVKVEGPIDEAAVLAERGVTRAYFGYTDLANTLRDAIVLGREVQAKESSVLEPLALQMERAYALARRSEGETAERFINEAKVRLLLGDTVSLAKAGPLIASALAHSPRRIDLYYAQAQLAYQQGNTTQAIKILDDVATQFPEAVGENERKRADILFAAHETAAALKALANAKKYGILPTLAEYERWAERAVLRKDWEGAVMIYEASLDDYPETPRSLANLAQVYKAMGDRVRARATAETLRARFPEFAPLVEEFLTTL